MKEYKVLIVDDSPADRLLIRDTIRMIKDIYFNVKQCGTISDAISDIETFEPDVIILDYWFEGENGFDLYDKHPALKNSAIPIVLCTGGADLKVVDEAKKHGVKHIVSKNAMTVALLESRLKDALSNHKPAPSGDDGIELEAIDKKEA
ncbi:MAG: response regulator [Rickettsiales bacterium]|nr:response regulator [Rickettsiales bacterium]